MAKEAKGVRGEGIKKPLALSSDLCEMLDVEEGTMMPRFEVVKRVWAYIKQNNLKDPNNGKIVIPDAKMQAVFGKEKFVGFTMMKHLKNHLA